MSSIGITSLIISNLFPVIGVLFFGWDASPIIFLYWFENIVIGIYNVLKMLFAKGKIVATTPGNIKLGTNIVKIFLIPFFCIHYGLFVFGHGVFLFSLLIKDLSLDNFLLIAIFILFVSHGVSFLNNYIRNNEYKRANLGILMFAPYGRIIIMHLVIIFTGMIVVALGTTLPSLLLLIALKTIADLLGHMFEHKENNVYVPAPWASKFITRFSFGLTPFLEAAYRTSVRTGQFDEISKDLSPEYVEYIKKFWDTPKDLRSKLKPPYETLGKADEEDSTI